MAKMPLDRLRAQLLTTGLQQQNFPLYQVINELIKAIGVSIDKADLALSGGGSGGPTGIDELIPGSGIEIRDMPGGKKVISSVVPFGDGGGEGGEDGPPGPPGKDGISIIGPQGSSGNPGMPGLDGEDGEDGLPGLQGPQGFPGSIGSAGPPGIPGIDGIDGEDGEDGIPGPIGLTGSIGPQGIQGINGIPGPPGLDAEEPEIPYIIPGPMGPQGPAGGGGGSATTIEVNLGATATWRGRFTITDAAITSAKKILCWQAPGPYTGKGTRADEAEFQPVSIVSVIPAAGSAIVDWQTPPIIAMRMIPRSQNCTTTAGTNVVVNPKDPQAVAWGFSKRIHRVRGNVKFNYLVFS